MKIKRFLCLLLAIFCLSSIATSSVSANGLDDFAFGLTENGNPVIATSNENYGQSWKNIYDKYKTVINFLYIIMTLTCLAGLIFSIVKLGSSGGNPQMRQQAIMGILFCGIGVALLGSVGIWFGFAMNIL